MYVRSDKVMFIDVIVVDTIVIVFIQLERQRKGVFFFDDSTPSHADVLTYIVTTLRTGLLALEFHIHYMMPKLDAQHWRVE